MGILVLHLTPKEDDALTQLAAEQDMTEQGILRLALRQYQLMHRRIEAGETVAFSGDAQRARDFAGPLWENRNG